MELIVMRHGHAEAMARCDEERQLSGHGRENVEYVARALAALGARPTRILASPLVRAQQTGQIVRDVFDPTPDLVTESRIVPEGRPDDIAAVIPTDVDNVLLASHMPFVGDVLGRVMAGSSAASIPLSTACAVWLEISHPKSRDGRLIAAVSPSAARRLLDRA